LPEKGDSQIGGYEMKYRPIVIDETLQELTPHGTDDFPISMDEQIVNDPQCDAIEHWHYEIQICLVTKGEVIIRTPGQEVLLHKGEGFFINSGVIHAPVSVGTDDNVYVCVNFHPRFIYGALNSVIRMSYVEPILSNPALQAFALTDEPWHKEICSLLQQLAEVNQQQSYGYELQMHELICRIWQLIAVNNRDKLETQARVSFADNQRTKALQKFIQLRYMDQLTLADIADSAHISRGECCRVLKRVTGISPIALLCKLRISQSVKLLTCSAMSISEIARSVGFESSSYFTVRFKEEMGCTPKEYRQRSKRKDGAAIEEERDLE